MTINNIIKKEMTMDQNWKSDFSTNETKRACVHEAGHIIVAVAMGYVVNSSCIDEFGNGGTSISYGNDTLLAKAFDSCDEKKICSFSGSDAFGEFVVKYIPILFAGHTAEFLFEKNETSEMADVKFDGKDAHDIAFFQRILKNNLINLSKISTTLLRDNQSILENLAENLYCNKTMNAEEINGLTQNLIKAFKS